MRKNNKRKVLAHNPATWVLFLAQVCSQLCMLDSVTYASLGMRALLTIVSISLLWIAHFIENEAEKKSLNEKILSNHQMEHEFNQSLVSLMSNYSYRIESIEQNIVLLKSTVEYHQRAIDDQTELISYVYQYILALEAESKKRQEQEDKDKVKQDKKIEERSDSVSGPIEDLDIS
jgi:hypothetical protein